MQSNDIKQRIEKLTHQSSNGSTQPFRVLRKLIADDVINDKEISEADTDVLKVQSKEIQNTELIDTETTEKFTTYAEYYLKTKRSKSVITPYPELTEKQRKGIFKYYKTIGVRKNRVSSPSARPVIGIIDFFFVSIRKVLIERYIFHRTLIS